MILKVVFIGKCWINILAISVFRASRISPVEFPGGNLFNRVNTISTSNNSLSYFFIFHLIPPAGLWYVFWLTGLISSPSCYPVKIFCPGELLPKKPLTGNIFSVIFRNMSNYQDKKIEKFADMFKALSNPNRLKIFLNLISCCRPGTITAIKDKTDPERCACVGELGQELGIVPSTISHHIKELRQAGLIRMERRGQKIECSIDPETIAALQSFFSQ